jgi:hypothetical protein
MLFRQLILLLITGKMQSYDKTDVLCLPAMFHTISHCMTFVGVELVI